MNDQDRAQQLELADRDLCLRSHANRPRHQAVAVKRPDGGTDYYCAKCDEDLPAHRVEFGICIECARAAEIRGKQYVRK